MSHTWKLGSQKRVENDGSRKGVQSQHPILLEYSVLWSELMHNDIIVSTQNYSSIWLDFANYYWSTHQNPTVTFSFWTIYI